MDMDISYGWNSAQEALKYNGMLGQNVIIYPDMDMVLVTNAGNKEMFQDCIMLNIIRKIFPC